MHEMYPLITFQTHRRIKRITAVLKLKYTKQTESQFNYRELREHSTNCG